MNLPDNAPPEKWIDAYLRGELDREADAYVEEKLATDPAWKQIFQLEMAIIEAFVPVPAKDVPVGASPENFAYKTTREVVSWNIYWPAAAILLTLVGVALIVVLLFSQRMVSSELIAKYFVLRTEVVRGPTSATAHFAEGERAFRDENYAEAAAAFARAEEMDTVSIWPEARFNQGVSAFRAGNTENSLIHFETLATLSSFAERATWMQALILARSRKPQAQARALNLLNTLLVDTRSDEIKRDAIALRAELEKSMLQAPQPGTPR